MCAEAPICFFKVNTVEKIKGLTHYFFQSIVSCQITVYLRRLVIYNPK